MKRINYKPSLSELKTKAKEHGLMICKNERGEDSFMLVDMQTNFVQDPYPLTLEEIEATIDNLDSHAE